MKITFRNRPVIFVDVEASSLDESTFPIEIGWSSDDEQPPPAFLIKPTVGWNETDVYQAGLRIHGIPYPNLITHGVDILDIPKQLKQAWKDAVLISDNPQFDAAWITQVYDIQGQSSPWRFVEFDVLFSDLCQFAGLSPQTVYDIITAAERIPRPHRAGPDALRLHQIARMLVDPGWRAKFVV